MVYLLAFCSTCCVLRDLFSTPTGMRGDDPLRRRPYPADGLRSPSKALPTSSMPPRSDRGQILRAIRSAGSSAGWSGSWAAWRPVSWGAVLTRIRSIAAVKTARAAEEDWRNLIAHGGVVLVSPHLLRLIIVGGARRRVASTGNGMLIGWGGLVSSRCCCRSDPAALRIYRGAVSPAVGAGDGEVSIPVLGRRPANERTDPRPCPFAAKRTGANPPIIPPMTRPVVIAPNWQGRPHDSRSPSRLAPSDIEGAMCRRQQVLGYDQTARSGRSGSPRRDPASLKARCHCADWIEIISQPWDPTVFHAVRPGRRRAGLGIRPGCGSGGSLESGNTRPPRRTGYYTPAIIVSRHRCHAYDWTEPGSGSPQFASTQRALAYDAPGRAPYPAAG